MAEFISAWMLLFVLVIQTTQIIHVLLIGSIVAHTLSCLVLPLFFNASSPS
jgi:hypothetical protein